MFRGFFCSLSQSKTSPGGYVMNFVSTARKKQPKKEESLIEKALEKVKPYKCSLCGQGFSYPSSVRPHYHARHTKFVKMAEKQGVIQNCIKCSQMFTSVSEKDKHKCVRFGKTRKQFFAEVIEIYKKVMEKEKDVEKKD